MKNKSGESESKKKSEKSIWFVKFKSSNGIGKKYFNLINGNKLIK